VDGRDGLAENATFEGFFEQGSRSSTVHLHGDQMAWRKRLRVQQLESNLGCGEPAW
jgi:hypothetical protein